MPASLQRKENTARAIERINRGELTVSSTNLDMIRRETTNVATTETILLDMALSKAVVDSYVYFNTPHNPQLIKMVIEEIKDVYRLQSPVEILQAIKDGRRAQEKVYGKLSPAHIMEWIRQFDMNTMPAKSDHTQSRKLGDREDKYDHDSDEEVRAIYGQLADKYSRMVEKRQCTQQEKERALMERYETVSEDERTRREYARAWNLDEHGDYETYMKRYEEAKATDKKEDDEGGNGQSEHLHSRHKPNYQRP